MKTFQVEVIETLSRVIEVKANSLEDALTVTETNYKNEVIVLDDSDFVDYEIKQLED